jgi:hypothetical protein
LPFFFVEYGPHRLLSGREASGDVEQLIGVDRWAPFEFAHKIPTGRAL